MPLGLTGVSAAPRASLVLLSAHALPAKGCGKHCSRGTQPMQFYGQPLAFNTNFKCRLQRTIVELLCALHRLTTCPKQLDLHFNGRLNMIDLSVSPNS